MQSLNISTSAMRGIQQALDNTASNLANLDTIGYKRRHASFSELLSDSMNEQPRVDNQNRNTPFGLRIGSGARLGLTKLDLGQGNVKITDVPTDVMIEGDGYFAVSRQTDNNNEDFFLTRDGNFKITKHVGLNQFALATASGDYVLDKYGVPITLTDPNQPIRIEADGKVYNVDDETPIAEIGIWKVNNPDQLQQVGKDLYDADIDDPIKLTDKYADAVLEGIATVRQGALEGSNVTMTEEMSQLVNIQRAYQLNSRAIGISDQMMGIANSIRSR